MADPKSAQQLLDELPKNDALKTLQELTTWIESVREDEKFRLDNRFEALRLLDETARLFERKLARELYASATLSRFQENRLWTALNDFYTQVSQAYGAVLASCRNGDKGSAALRLLQPLIAARAIHALRGRLKCAAMRYAQAEPELWGLLAAAYSSAELENYLDEPIALYPASGANSSVRCEFTSVLLWWVSGTGTLKQQQMHLAERVIAHMCRNYTVQAQLHVGTLLTFDIVQPRPPVRFTGDATVHPSLRFVGLGQVQAQLDAINKTLDKGIVPEDINLGGTYEAEVVQQVTRHLAAVWSMPPPMRRTARRRISVNLDVAGGFASMVEQTDVGLNFSGTESWEVEEISANGFRCVLPPAKADAVKIGLLVGIKPEKVERWGAGIVRRLGRDGENNLHVGVETLSNQLQGVALRESNRAGADDDQLALWLVRGEDDAGEAFLLMKPDTFSINRSLHMHVSGRQYLLMPLALVEKGEDYDFARYRKIEQDTSSEEEAY